MYHIVNGIVLNRYNFSDWDKIVVLYTLQLGKVKVLFKSVNKPQAKLLSFTEPATEVELQIVSLNKAGYKYMFKVTGGEIINSFPVVKNKLDLYLTACEIFDLVDSLTFELSKDEQKFFLLKRALEILCLDKNKELLFLAFVFRFIKLCGYMPQLYKCVKCKSEINYTTTVKFDFASSSVICDKCRRISNINYENTMTISAAALHLIRKFYQLSAEQVTALSVESQIIYEIKKFMYLYLQNYLLRPLKCWS